MPHPEQPAAPTPEHEQADSAPAPDQTASAEEAEPSLATLASEWLETLGERIRAHADLVLAETKLALGTFMLMIFLAILSAGAVLFAWAFLMLAVAQVPLSLGVSPAVTALILVVAHGVLALVLWRTANSLGRNMEFRATRRLLRPRPDRDDTMKHDEL